MAQTALAASPSPPSSREQDSVDAQRLREWLADHDVECPLCKYNLRGLVEPRCPECGNGLTLGVSLVEPFLAAWIATVSALLPPAGFGCIFTCVFFDQLIRYGWRQTVSGGTPQLAAIILLCYVVAAVPLSFLAIWKRRTFMRWEQSTQKLLAALAWGADVSLLILFLYEIQ